MSKPLFAYVVLKLSEKGTLDLDTPLTRHTRDKFIDGDPRLDLITARQILSHTSGIVPDWRSAAQPLRIAYDPRKKWSYSGEGYYYLQSVVTELKGRIDLNQCGQFETGLRVCATNFGEYMQSKLIDPFGMKRSGYVWRDQFARQRARPHDVNGNPLPYRTNRAVDNSRYCAAGVLMATPGDYAAFLMEIPDPKPQDEFRLSVANVTQMTTPQIEVARSGEDIISWGLGWRIARTSRGVYFGHGGENPGFQCISEACVEDRCGFVIMTNSDNGAKLLEKLARGFEAAPH